MHRRDFLALTAAVTLMPMVARADAAAYTPEALEAALASGKPVFLDFKASWCGTCKAQGRVISALKAENPAYEAGIVFLDVDWDTWKDAMIVSEMNIPRRSTLVVLKGDQELGRIVAGTGRDEIKALMDTALAAA
jgi:thiol:disulfide interchange protein